MSLIIMLLAALLISIVDAKPISQNQVKFRRLPPKEFSAVLGSSITIECEAGGSPAPTIHWLKDGKRIVQKANQLQQQLSSIQLEENQLEVMLAPVQANGASGVNSNNENSFTDRLALSFTRSRLFIDCADDLDQAVYTCVAENIFSRISSHTKLNLINPVTTTSSSSANNNNNNENELINASLEEVAASARGDSDQMSAEKSLSAMPQCLNEKGSRTTEPVRIYMWTHNMVEILKNSLVLFCRSNVRKPLASWTLPDGKQVSAEHRGKFNILESGDLLIKDLRWADMGSYVCTVSDDQSSDSISTFVYPAAMKPKNKRPV